MTRTELTERFAQMRSEMAERFAGLRRITDPLPNTIYAIRDRQDKVVDNINSLVR